MSVKGMEDIMPPASRVWQNVEAAARRVFGLYGCREIRTPIVEKTALFRRGVGETTAIVEKEMYAFVDQGGDDLSLRPEGTASVVRAYIEAGAHVSEPIVRYYYMGPMFRRERPQKGRQRQFYQIGCEVIGVESPAADAEVMAMTAQFFSDIGVKGVELEINSIGCAKCRPEFNEKLLKFLHGCRSKLCDDCIRRIEKNPMRALDCKREECKEELKNAPLISKHLCADCAEHFGLVKKSLDLMGISYKQNDRIVRGLDYYMRTAFEFTTDKLGAQNAVAAGGRYNGLVKALGGPDVAGVGIAIGMERTILLMDDGPAKNTKEEIIFFAVIGERAKDAALPIIQTLRRDGVRVEWDYAEHSLKAQMRRAGKLEAKTVIILGDDEVSKGEVIIRDMRAQTQKGVKIKDLPMHFIDVGG